MGKAATKAQNKYISKTYDRINLVIPKGKKADLQAHADSRNESVNAFINRAIETQLAIDGGILNIFSQPAQTPGANS